MDSNLRGGFIMAGVAVLVTIIGGALYCLFGIGCHSTEEIDEEKRRQREEKEAQDEDDVDGEAGKTLDSEGNPLPLEDIREDGDVNEENPEAPC